MGSNTKKNSLHKCLFIAGTVFFLSAAALYLFNLWEDRDAGRQAQSVLRQFREAMQGSAAQVYTASSGRAETAADTRDGEPLSQPGTDAGLYVPDYILNPDMDMPTAKIDGNLYIGTICFPSLGLELPVMSSWSYPDLKIAPCLFYGSIYTGNAVICAHNYKSHFGRMTELITGDPVLFTDADGNVFRYTVVVQEVLAAEDYREMIAGEYPLSLFDCTKSGASRYTVRCRAV